MKYRRFGRTGWMVSELGYGMWGMSSWTGSSDAESRQSLQRAVDLGCNFFDTAWHYGSGHSEELLGELVRRNPRKKLYVATKIPPKNLAWPARPEFTLDDCYPPEHIEQYVRISLKNLGLENFDLIQFHSWSDAWLEDDRWAKKIDELRRQGLFQAVGMSLNRWEPWNGVRAVNSGLMDNPPWKLKPVNFGTFMVVGAPASHQVIRGRPIKRASETFTIGKICPVAA